MLQQNSVPIELAILGGDPTVGRSLERLLRNAGYVNARFLDWAPAGEPAELLGGARLVILWPRLNAGDREAFVSSVRSSPAKAGIPVLELVTAPFGIRNRQGDGVGPWSGCAE